MASGVEFWSKEACTIQSSASSLGRYSWRITPGVLAPVVGEAEQALGGADPSGAVHRGLLAPHERLAVLGQDRETGLLGEVDDVVVRLRERGRRTGNAVFHAQFVQALFAREAAWQGGLDAREQEAARQFVLVFGDQDGGLLVGGTRTMGRPMRRPMRSSPSTKWAGSSVPVVGQTKAFFR